MDKEVGFLTEPELFIKKIGKVPTRLMNKNSTFVGLSKFNNIQKKYPNHKTPAAMRLHRPFKTIHEEEEPTTNLGQCIQGGLHTILMTKSNHPETSTPTNDSEALDKFNIHDLQLPEMNAGFTLNQYLQSLRLSIIENPVIDKTGSCGYDSIWYSIKEDIHKLSLPVTKLLNRATKFPIRDLCKKLLRFPPNGKPWDFIYELFREEVKNQLMQTRPNMSNIEIDDEIKVRWESQADGDTWIDTYVLRLIAVTLNYDMVIFQNQPNNIRKFNMTSVSGENTSRFKKPILLLLSHSHYTPLRDVSDTEAWYKLCSNGRLPPW